MTSTPPNERLAVPVSPTSVCLPAGSFMVEDADEEIFLLLTGKQRGKESDDGLGFATTTKSSETIPISITVQEREWEGHGLGSQGRCFGESPPDIIIAADCIFNPFLSAPLARTINALAGPRTVALVASELRDPEPLELFLREWLDLGWKMASSSSSPTSAGSSALNMLEFFHTIEKLKTEKRTGWVNHGVDKPESIADHMYRMAMMAMVLPPDAGVDISKVMMLALVHDMAEADVGDITPEHVSGVTKEDKLALEEKAMERIGGLLGHPSIPSLRIRSLWEEYEARETPESKVCKDLDLFELCVQAVEYENSQKIRTLQEFFATTVSRILHPTIKVWAHELMLKRKEAWEERGWTEYVHLDVAPDPTTDVVSPRAAPIPQHVYGEHAASLDEQ
ncbi:hypothetical protein RQP46_004973 [Phenoliferia psychrophenolica]